LSAGAAKLNPLTACDVSVALVVGVVVVTGAEFPNKVIVADAVVFGVGAVLVAPNEKVEAEIAGTDGCASTAVVLGVVVVGCLKLPKLNVAGGKVVAAGF